MANLEKLDQLPKKESRKEYITKKYGDMWELPRFDGYWLSNKSDYPRTKIQRVIQKFLGRSFDDAFSYYCTLVPKYQQKDFLETFENPYRYKYNEKFIVNKEGNIIINPDKHIYPKREISLKSLDYEEGYVHKITKKILTPSEYWKVKWFYQNEYTRIISKGYVQIFESKKDPEYKRLKAALVQQKKLNNRAWKIYNRTKAVCFLTSDERQKKSEIPLDIINRDRHGFDKNSFIGK